MRRPERILTVFWIFAAGLSAGPIGIGIKAGIPLTDPVQLENAAQHVDTHRWLFGPMVELRLPFGLGVEADAIYRSFDFRATLGQSVPVRASTGLWEVPVLLKYRLGGLPLAHPFVDGGPVWGRASLSASLGPRQFTGTYNGAGATFGGGIELNLLLLRISPEIRYTHWGSAIFGHRFGVNERFSQNQAEFMVGIAF